MTSPLSSHTTTDVKPEMLSGVQTGNGISHDKYDVCGIAHALTNRKDDIFMQRRLYIDEAHTALDIFRFAVFFLLKTEIHTQILNTEPMLHDFKGLGYKQKQNGFLR